MKKYSLTREKRLRRNTQIRKALSAGKSVRDGILTIYMAKNDCGFSRLGVSVSKSCGSAVKRNKLKRLVREVFRQNQYDIPESRDYLILIRKKIDQPSFELIKDSFLRLIIQIK